VTQTRRGRLVHLNRALSKRGILTRSRATEAILAGRVSVDGRVVRDPGAAIDIDRADLTVDLAVAPSSTWRTVVLHKPRGVLTTTHDPEGRPTVYALLDADGQSLVPVGRLDLATTGVLLLTTDTELAGWLTDPVNAIERRYIATVRGRVTAPVIAEMERGVMVDGDVLTAASVVARKVSDRESHLIIELREGKNREIRRLCEAVGHEVTRLKRVSFGRIELDDLPPGRWRELTREDVGAAFPAAPLRR
jgi:23S rRNA pseudouridine2605 synthase